MRTLLAAVLAVIVILPFPAGANEKKGGPCEWYAEVISVITENKVSGMSELDLVENYLASNPPAEERPIVLQWIDVVYNNKLATEDPEEMRRNVLIACYSGPQVDI